MLRGIINDEHFSSVAVAKSSVAAAGLCSWVIAVNDYCQIMREVRMIRAAMEEQETALS